MASDEYAQLHTVAWQAAQYFGVKQPYTINYAWLDADDLGMPGQILGLATGNNLLINWSMIGEPDFRDVVCHEMRHKWQTENGFDFRYDLPYRERPQEIDAFGNQSACAAATLAMGSPPVTVLEENMASSQAHLMKSGAFSSLLVILLLVAALNIILNHRQQGVNKEDVGFLSALASPLRSINGWNAGIMAAAGGWVLFMVVPFVMDVLAYWGDVDSIFRLLQSSVFVLIGLSYLFGMWAVSLVKKGVTFVWTGGAMVLLVTWY